MAALTSREDATSLRRIWVLDLWLILSEGESAMEIVRSLYCIRA